MSSQKQVMQERKYLRTLLPLVGRGVTSIVLVGSVARRLRGPNSDVDFLVVGERNHEAPPVGMHVTVLSEEALRKRCKEGDDFVQWALRFGKPIAGSREWGRMKDQLVCTACWPNPMPKVESAWKHLKAAEELLSMDDWEATMEEASFALSQLARFELLRNGVFPLSRPELPGQLKSVRQEELGAMLSRLLSTDQLDYAVLGEIVAFLRHRLGALRGDQGTLPQASMRA